MVKNPPANPGDMGSVPGLGRFHMSWDNEACVPQLLKPSRPRAHVPQQKKPLQIEAHTPKLESNACSPQLEKAHMQQEGPSAMKNK